MTFAEIKAQVMFQSNNDEEDLEDYLPHADDYVNEGYDKMVNAWAKQHIPIENYQRLEEDEDVPVLPEWTHRALADYATWLIYRNGNPQKQQRGLYYLRAFEEVLARIRDEGGADGLNEDGSRKVYNRFVNIPV